MSEDSQFNKDLKRVLEINYLSILNIEKSMIKNINYSDRDHS